MPSLEELLKNKPLTNENKFVRKSFSVTTEDRPYSIIEAASTQLIKTESNVETIQEKLEPKLSQTKVKVEPNLSQSRVKDKSNADKLEPKLSQTKAKVETKLKPKLSQKTQTIPRNNLNQTEVKAGPSKDFSLLVGLQKQIAIFLFEECQSTLTEETTGLTIDYISMSCNTTKSAARKALQRLEQKKIIIRYEFKNGRSGWTRYKLPDVIYQEIHHLKSLNKLEPKLSQAKILRLNNLSQTEAKLRTELEPSVSSSSSDINIKETTTELTEEWSFDITPYSKFGFMTSQLKQLASLGVISAIDVEQSLLEFNHDLDNNALPKMNTGKINFLMGILRKGQSYVSDSYRNDEEALISEMADRAENKRKKILEDKFILWEASLSDEERKSVENKVPLHLRVMFQAHGIANLEIKGWLFNYYLKTTSN